MAKPKKLSSTEVVIAGQPSAGLLAALKTAGEKITVKQLAVSLGHLEAARVGFVVEAIATGILLIAKIETLSHGERQKFAAEVWAAIKHSGSGASDLTSSELDNFTRSLRVYRFCAQHFLADLEQNAFQPEGRDQKVIPPAVEPAEVLALETLPQEKRIAVYNAIERFVAGRSLRRILIDFRRAEGAADQEEIDEENRRKKKKKPPGGDPAQLDFYQDMLRPLGEIDTLFTTKSFVEKTDKAFWLGIADKLEAQASRARQLAKEVA